uniref:PA14 domain-containing protein n=1 Tax=Clytia hemisphaerica TaxID=252671 RepID=A0A7M5XID8_9CNID
SYEDAYFELLHKDKIHGRSPAKSAVLPTRFDCMQLCKNSSGCLSINWNEDETKCEIVNYDRHNAPTYTDKPGWKHYDGGDQHYVVLKTWGGYVGCYRGDGNSCSLGRVLSTGTGGCNVNAGNKFTYEYNQAVGTLRSMCSNQNLCPSHDIGGDTNPNVQMGNSDQCNTFDAKRRFRRTHYGISFHNYCMYMWGDGATGANQYLELGRCTNHNAIKIMMDSSLANAPVKTTLWEGISNYDSVTDAYNSRGSIHSTGYSDGFVFQTWGDWYVVKMQALFIAPETGSYVFRVAVDDFAQLFLSSDATEANKVNILEDNNNCPDANGWDYTAAKDSNTVALEKGKAYYIEVLLYEKDADEYLQLFMKKPSAGEVGFEFVETNYLRLIESEWET